MGKVWTNLSFLEIFFKQLKQNNDCIDWVGCLNNKGYGSINTGKIVISVHRFIYEFETKTEIPNGKVVNHKCFNKRCCNIDHLELLSNGENLRYSHQYCKLGHKIEGDNVIIDKSNGRRRCKICRRNYQKRYNKSYVSKMG